MYLTSSETTTISRSKRKKNMESEGNMLMSTWQQWFLSNLRNCSLALCLWKWLHKTDCQRQNALIWSSSQQSLAVDGWTAFSLLQNTHYISYTTHWLEYTLGGQRQSKNNPTIFTLPANAVSRCSVGYNEWEEPVTNLRGAALFHMSASGPNDPTS